MNSAACVSTIAICCFVFLCLFFKRHLSLSCDIAKNGTMSEAACHLGVDEMTRCVFRKMKQSCYSLPAALSFVVAEHWNVFPAMYFLISVNFK